MIIVDDKGNMFDDRRKEDRRKQDIPVEEERRKEQRRTNEDNRRHEVTEDQIEALKDPNQVESNVTVEKETVIENNSEETSEAAETPTETE